MYSKLVFLINCYLCTLLGNTFFNIEYSLSKYFFLFSEDKESTEADRRYAVFKSHIYSYTFQVSF